jgi:hypothetical protein
MCQCGKWEDVLSHVSSGECSHVSVDLCVLSDTAFDRVLTDVEKHNRY